MVARVAVFMSAHPDSIVQAKEAWTKACDLVARGVEAHVYVSHLTSQDRIDAIRLVASSRPDVVCPLHDEFTRGEPFDLGLFFGWRTARMVDAIPIGRKALVLDDIEAWHHPMGDTFVAAEAALHCGLPCIALGRWVGRTLRTTFGLRTVICALGMPDAALRRAAVSRRRPAICAYWDPVAQNAAAALVNETLGIFNYCHPSVDLVLIGPEKASGQWYRCTTVTNARPEGRRELYESCSVGLCLSTVSQHRVGLEMVAHGLPVVNLFQPVNLFDYPPASLYLAHQTPESLSRALEIALDLSPSVDRDELMDGMAHRTTTHEAQQFTDEVHRLIDGEPPPDASGEAVHPRFEGEPVLAPVYAGARMRDRLRYLSGAEAISDG